MRTNDPEVQNYSKSFVTSSQRCSAAQVCRCHQSPGSTHLQALSTQAQQVKPAPTSTGQW